MRSGLTQAVVPPTGVADSDLGLSAEARQLAAHREVTLQAIEDAARDRDPGRIFRLVKDLEGQQRLLVSPA